MLEGQNDCRAAGGLSGLGRVGWLREDFVMNFFLDFIVSSDDELL